MSTGALRLHSGLAGEQRRVTQRESAHNQKLLHASQCLCTSGLISLAYAILDELHQEVAPDRGFELADIGYDLVGIISALGLIWVRERGKANRRGGSRGH